MDKSAIHPKCQNEIEANLPESLRQGIKGWEVTDLRLTLVDGSHHLLHSRPGDFKLAANMAILKGLTETGTTLLEPMLAFRIAAPLEHLGGGSRRISSSGAAPASRPRLPAISSSSPAASPWPPRWTVPSA